MHTTSARIASLASLFLALAGCGGGATCPSSDLGVPDAAANDAGTDAGADAGPSAYELAGLWRFASRSSTDGTTVTTYSRGGAPQSLRGDALVGATSATSATVLVRLALLDAGVLATDAITQTHTMALEGDRWVMHDDASSTQVFHWTRTGEHLELTWDATDPRNAAIGSAHATAMVMDRVPLPTGIAFGRWQTRSMVVGGTRIDAGACLAASGTYASYVMYTFVSPLALVDQSMRTDFFSDSACTTSTTSSGVSQHGLGEEDGTRLSLYLRRDDGTMPVSPVFDVAPAADGTITLTRVSCLPSGCEATVPTEVELEPAPLP